MAWLIRYIEIDKTKGNYLQQLRQEVGADTLDIRRVNTPIGDFLMLVDDAGQFKEGLPLNPIATALYNTGSPIVGDAVFASYPDELD